VSAEIPSLDAIFCSAIEIAADEERAAYVARACGADAKLKAQVEKLVAAHFQAGSFLKRPAAAPAGIGAYAFGPAEEPTGASQAENREGAGTVIGAYKLLQEIGEGGMGTVWMAEQQEPVRRRVALKVIKAGMDSAQVIARFEAERQALALMDHPHIAKVLDAGTVGPVCRTGPDGLPGDAEGPVRQTGPTGRPFFVMELVKGTPITKYCDEHRLTPRQRLELFVPVCEAIQHAHQKGIIHRDVKPSNVLVAPYDGRPVVKVIDFGVAKATGQRLTERTLFTGFGAVVGTLEYMSPEQAELNNQDIDTRSDIYSLGVLLYELLTGTTPLTKERLKEGAFTEMLRLIREEEPPKPSTWLSSSETLPTIAAARQTEPAKLTKQVRGELDWIVMKALEKDRARRYQTANGFARDVERYLADEPVEACPPSAGYRLRKFARKNRRLLGTTGAFLGLLVLAVIGLVIGLVTVKTEQQKTQAALAAETTAKAQLREALDALTDDVVETMFARQPQLDETEKAFLRQVLGYYEAIALQAPETAEAQFLRAKGYFKVAHLRELLGDQAEAVAGYRQAALLLKQLAGEFPDVAEYRHKLARTNGNLGVLLAESGQEAEAETAFRQGIALRTKLAEDFPKMPEYRSELAKNYNDFAFLLERQEKYEEAAKAYHEALDRHEKLVAEFGGVPAYHQHLARSRSNLGQLLRKQAKYQEAEPLYRQALKVQEEQLEKFPGVARCRRQLADSHHGFGIVLAEMHNPVEAEKAFRRAVTLREKLTADFPKVARYRQELARTYSSLGKLLHAARRTEEAEAAWLSAKDLWEQLATGSPETADHQNELAGMLGRLAGLHFQRREFPAAVALLEQARPHHLAALKAGPKNDGYRQFYHNTLVTLARCHLALPDHARLAAAAEELVGFDYEPKSDAYNAANCLSRCILLLDGDSRLTETRRKELAHNCADRALALLRQAVAHGFKDMAKIQENPNFQPLRGREEYQRLLVGIETKNED
jgi:serine/threonine protein kinase/tetratricopeptide (TPR) repeat protein